MQELQRNGGCAVSIILICGGRDYSDKQRFCHFMDREHSVYAFTHVIHGACNLKKRIGADWMADEWAKARGIQPVACEALWDKQGNRAGPIRNRRMAELRPHWAYAFPGGSGTASMIGILEELGIDVIRVPAQGEESSL
jgi:hypothetical protein